MKEKALTYFRDVSDSAKQIITLLKKLDSKITNSDVNLKNGIGLLDVKNQLLVQYLMNLTYIMARKTMGLSIKGDASIDRLIEHRVALERIKPIDQKLKYQMDKLIRIATTGASDTNDPSRFRANPGNMLENEALESEDSEVENEVEKEKTNNSGLYVPPKLAAVYYTGDERKNEKEERMKDRARKYALNSSVVQELKEEYLDTPTEISATNSIKQHMNKYERFKQEYEESYFTRIPVTKEEKRRNKKLSTLGTLGDELTKFEDISALEGGDVTLLKSKKRKSGSVSKKSRKKKKRFH